MRASWVAASAVGLPIALYACAPVEAAHVGRAERVAAHVARHQTPAEKPPVAAAAWKAVEPAQPSVAERPKPASTPASAELRAATQKLRSTAPASVAGAAAPSSRNLGRDRDAWRAVLAHVPELSAYASSFEPFSADDTDEALKRGKRARENVIAWQMADGPIAWTPAQDRELWVAAGRVGDRALIAVIAPQRDGSMHHEVSLVIDDQDARVALATSAEHPSELLWSTCYGCPGEGGSIRLGDDGRAGFVYR